VHPEHDRENRRFNPFKTNNNKASQKCEDFFLLKLFKKERLVHPEHDRENRRFEPFKTNSNKASQKCEDFFYLHFLKKTKPILYIKNLIIIT